ncbi:MAG: hypothetical protein Q9168_003213 [Polycauliona sp. 1 TL-2023]
MGDENALLDFRKRFDELKAIDSQKQTLIQPGKDLIDQNEKLSFECKQIGQDLVIEKDARRLLQTRIKDELEPLTNRKGFILVLIDADGDGYVVGCTTPCVVFRALTASQFRDAFLNKNEEGGRLAADELLAQITRYIRNLNLDVEHTDVVVRAYANVRGLGRACVKNNLMKPTADLGLFANGFTGRHPLFDFVDVGLGKERADHKIRGMEAFRLSDEIPFAATNSEPELFRFYINGLQCKHVMLGVSHDSGYVPFLEKFVANESIRDRVTLLEGYQVIANQPQPTPPVTASRATKGPFHLSGVSSGRLGPVIKNQQGRRIDKYLNVNLETMQAFLKKKLCMWLFLKGSCVGCDRNHVHPLLNEQEYDALWFGSRRGRCNKEQRAKGCNDPTCIYGHTGKPVSDSGATESLKDKN